MLLGLPVAIWIDVLHDDEAGVYIATSKNVRGLVVEAETLDQIKVEVEGVLMDMLRIIDIARITGGTVLAKADGIGVVRSDPANATLASCKRPIVANAILPATFPRILESMRMTSSLGEHNHEENHASVQE